MCEVRRAYDGQNTLPIFTNLYWYAEWVSPGIKNQEVPSEKKYQMSHRGEHTHAWDKTEPWLPIKYIVDPCQTTMKSSHE